MGNRNRKTGMGGGGWEKIQMKARTSDQRISSRMLREMHRNRVYLRFVRIIPRRNGTDYIEEAKKNSKHNQFGSIWVQETACKRSIEYLLTVNKNGHRAKVEEGV